jgi:hypothetical protein
MRRQRDDRRSRSADVGAAIADVHVHPGKFPVVQSVCMQVRVSRYDSCELLCMCVTCILNVLHAGCVGSEVAGAAGVLMSVL